MADELAGINNARMLTADQFAGLADTPPELEWLANIIIPKRDACTTERSSV